MSNQVEIITIGDEILIGQIVDTNSAWMAQELNKHGFKVFQISSVSDDEAHILNAVEEAFSRADIVLLTGGLGPTKDDITKQTLCKYFNTELVYDESVLKNIEELFVGRPHVLNELTRNQAYVPKACTVIQNKVGTAPVTWFEKNGKVLVSMPGVPSEMMWVMSNEVFPRIAKKFETPVVLHKTVLVIGEAESALAIKIADWENALPEYISLAYLPSAGMVKLRLSAVKDGHDDLVAEIEKQLVPLREILGASIFAEEDLPLEQLVGEMLRKKGLNLATAESCTGGNIAHLVTLVPGSSAYFKGSVIAYCNEVKYKILGVSQQDLDTHGAVSQPVVEQMAQGVLRVLGADIAVATSGIAGPGGGTEEKPVGTVCIAVCTKEKVISRKYRFGSKRDRNIEMSTISAFSMIKELLEE